MVTRTRVLYIFFTLFLISDITFARAINEKEIKTAFIYNFIKHTTWKNEGSFPSIRISVYKDRKFYQFLKSSLSGKQLKNKNIIISYSENLEASRLDHVIYIPESLNDQLDKITFALRRSQSLVITKNSKNKKNVMINFNYHAETETLSFELNRSNIIYEELTISSNLLLLGGTELDVATLYRETEEAMQKMKLRENEMDNSISLLENKLKVSSKAFQQKLLKNNKTLDEKKAELEQLKLDISLQNRKLIKSVQQKENELTLLNEQKNTEILESQRILKQKNEEVEAREIEIQKMEMNIVNNRKKIDQQLSLIKKQKNDISTKDQKIKSKDTVLTVMFAFGLIVTAFTILVGLMFIRNRKVTLKLTSALSDLEHTQSHLVQSEKMASLGVLTTGVAHEINTPLGIIVTSLSVIEDHVGTLNKKVTNNKLSKRGFLKSLEDIEQSTQMTAGALTRLTTLINNFKQVASDHAIEEARPINLGSYISEIMGSLSRDLTVKGITYKVICVEEINMITIPGSLAQIFTNLVTNVINHAFAPNRFTGENKKITIYLSINDDINITFEDNGLGMNADVLKNIYEPFFTTMRNKGGTGLGMHIVYNIIEQTLMGEITVESIEGSGTKVILSLPQNITEAS